MATAIVITPADIAKRAKMRSGGGAMDDAAAEEKEDAAEGPVSEIKMSAVSDMVKALGLDPESKDVDLDAFEAALSDYVEACYSEEEPKKEATEKEAA